MLLKEIFLIIFLHISALVKAYSYIYGGGGVKFSLNNLSEEELSVFFSKLPYSSGLKDKSYNNLNTKKYSVDLVQESFYSRTSSLWLIGFYSSQCNYSKLFGILNIGEDIIYH